MSNIGNYAQHARYWDWSGHDRTDEHKYWYNYSAKYGKNILIPMCALAETGVYMANNGLNVTAFDFTPEMISESRKRFGSVTGLQLFVGDIRNFHFDIPPVDFCFCTDFQHLQTIEDIKKSLACINTHLREGGCLVVETGLRMPDAESFETELQTFYPLKQVYPNIKVWKTGISRNEADTGRFYITQTFYAEDKSGNLDSFDHAFYLQSYTREEWLKAFSQCGFELTGEYNNRELESWLSGGSAFRIFEAIKVTSI